MGHDYDPRDGEFAAAIAASAFAIHRLGEAELANERKMRDGYEKSKEKANDSLKITRPISRNVSIKRSMEDGRKSKEITAATWNQKPGRSASMRATNVADQRRRMNLPRSNVVETREDSWEMAQLRKINKRYEDMKSKILAWENERKMKVKLQMEKKKNELEMRRVRNYQHYQNKLERIGKIAGGARAQLEEKRRNEEVALREKAKYMRSKGKSSAYWICC